jgi:hypothetical protein
MPLAILALAAVAAACSNGPQVSAQQKRAVAGILGSPTSSTAPSSGRKTTTTTSSLSASNTTTTTTSSAPSTTPTSTSVGPGTTPSPGLNGTTPSTSPPGTPPNVVGQSLATAQNLLGAAGYNTTAHPWGGSCSTANVVMQQVPPQSGTVALFYCATAS